MNIITSKLMTKRIFKERPKWMFFDWLPFRWLRYFLVRYWRKRWLEIPLNVVDVPIKGGYLIGNDFIVHPIIANELENLIPINPSIVETSYPVFSSENIIKNEIENYFKIQEAFTRSNSIFPHIRKQL